MRIPRPRAPRAAAALLIPLLAACGGVIVSETFGEVGDEHAVHGSAKVHPSTPPGADHSAP